MQIKYPPNFIKINKKNINSKIHQNILKDFSYFIYKMWKINNQWLLYPIEENENIITIYMAYCPDDAIEEFCTDNQLINLGYKYYDENNHTLGCIYKFKKLKSWQ